MSVCAKSRSSCVEIKRIFIVGQLFGSDQLPSFIARAKLLVIKTGE